MLSTLLAFFIIINSINLNQPVIPMPAESVTINGVSGYRPLVDENNVSWYERSAKPGENGNILIYGHNPGVFSDLDSVALGDLIIISYEERLHIYEVVFIAVVDNSVENGKYIEQSNYEKLTLITCQERKRLIVVATKL